MVHSNSQNGKSKVDENKVWDGDNAPTNHFKIKESTILWISLAAIAILAAIFSLD